MRRSGRYVVCTHCQKVEFSAAPPPIQQCHPRHFHGHFWRAAGVAPEHEIVFIGENGEWHEYFVVCGVKPDRCGEPDCDAMAWARVDAPDGKRNLCLKCYEMEGFAKTPV